MVEIRIVRKEGFIINPNDEEVNKMIEVIEGE